MINIEELALEAGNMLQEGIIGPAAEVMINRNITTRTLMVLESNPLITASMVIDARMVITTLQALLAWYWEMGRLYGKIEVVNEALKGMEGGE